MTLQCVCGWLIRGRADLRAVDGEVFRCQNRACVLDEICRVVSGDRGYMVGFSPMFSDWNLLRMGRDKLERELENISAEIVGFLGGGVKVFRVVIRWR